MRSRVVAGLIVSDSSHQSMSDEMSRGGVE